MDGRLLGAVRVEVDHRGFAFCDNGTQLELIAASGVDEVGQRVLFMVHSVERDAVRSAHREESPPFMHDNIARLLALRLTDNGGCGEYYRQAGCDTDPFHDLVS